MRPEIENHQLVCHIVNGFVNFFASFILIALVIDLVFVSITRDCFTCLGVHGAEHGTTVLAVSQCGLVTIRVPRFQANCDIIWPIVICS